MKNEASAEAIRDECGMPVTREDAAEALRAAMGLAPSPGAIAYLSGVVGQLEVAGFSIVQATCPECDRWLSNQCAVHGQIE